MQLVASGWLVFQLTDSAMAVGVLGLLALGPALVGSPTGGWLADRFCPRKLAVTLSALSSIGPAALTLIAFTGEPTVAQIYVFTLVGAIPNSIAAPIKAIVTPYSVPAALRRQAVSDVRIVGVGAAAFFALIGPLQALMPKLAAAHDDDPMLLGALLASISVGSLLANRVIRRRLTDSRSATRLLVEGLVIAGVATLGLSASRSMITDCVLLVGVGIGWEAVYVAGLSTLQLDVPADISGRVVGAAYLCISCCLAGGAVVIGWLLDAVGVGWSLVGIVRFRDAGRRSCCSPWATWSSSALRLSSTWPWRTSRGASPPGSKQPPLPSAARWWQPGSSGCAGRPD